ncbi:putative F-box protein At1g32420 [Prosopis cineraria]|uniref:putative F-box protein At1g32420 n=1 Tax=Prosopis cineraria TaxID=364024 RepID=UPI002410AAE3|nr:putative F-box protein At1g32420 [Prosopis cineraria]
MIQAVVDSDPPYPYLADEIIRNILIRLPVKSLIRFQCVCKHWKNVIKSASFVADHLHISALRDPLLLLHYSAVRSNSRYCVMLDYKFRVLELLPSPLISQKVTIISSSNGLLCAQIHIESQVLPSLLLWNPATREARLVPHPVNNHIGYFKLGFGFSSIVNDYKIVMFYYDYKVEAKRVVVYSLSTCSWREIKVVNLGGLSLDFPTITLHGAIFWRGYRLGGGVGDWIIVSFGIAMEVFTLITPPPKVGFHSCRSLTVYENKLALFSRAKSENNDSFVIDLWVMEEGTGESGKKKGWNKIYSISTILDMVPYGFWFDEVVCKDDDPPDDLFEFPICRLNLNTHELETFATFRRGYQVSIVCNHVESLVPLGNIHIEEA